MEQFDLWRKYGDPKLYALAMETARQKLDFLEYAYRSFNTAAIPFVAFVRPAVARNPDGSERR